jgi:hypothetical protein
MRGGMDLQLTDKVAAIVALLASPRAPSDSSE